MDWHHAPLHRLGDAGAYIVTAATCEKQLLFRTRKRLDMLQQVFFAMTTKYSWDAQSWSLFPNHYHFIAYSETESESLRELINDLHSTSGRELNRMDGTPGRRVWYQFWDTHLTHQGSYMARLRYVNENPVHHGVVSNAANYRWCSAGWFERNASPAFYKAVTNMKTDRIKIIDDFR